MIKLSALIDYLMVPGYKYLQDSELIVRFEGTGNYTLLHLKRLPHPLRVNETTLLTANSSDTLMVSKTLKYFEDQLPNFIRINKSLLLNPLYIDKVLTVNSRIMKLLLTDGTIAEASRRRIGETANKLSLYSAGVKRR